MYLSYTLVRQPNMTSPRSTDSCTDCGQTGKNFLWHDANQTPVALCSECHTTAVKSYIDKHEPVVPKVSPTFHETFLPLVLSMTCYLLTSSLPTINRRCAAYTKGANTQDKGINKNFENLVGDAVRQVLTSLGIAHTSAILDVLSDVSIETEDFILQVDAKGCIVTDHDFSVKNGHLHGHCGKAQTSLVSTKMFKDRKTGEIHETRGIQKETIDGKPVYTFVVFMRWGFSEEKKYYIESCGSVFLPHVADDFDFKVGKSHDEMRWIVKNPELFRIHRFASESPSQTLDSTQSECIEVPETSQQGP